MSTLSIRDGLTTGDDPTPAAAPAEVDPFSDQALGITAKDAAARADTARPTPTPMVSPERQTAAEVISGILAGGGEVSTTVTSGITNDDDRPERIDREGLLAGLQAAQDDPEQVAFRERRQQQENLNTLGRATVFERQLELVGTEDDLVETLAVARLNMTEPEFESLWQRYDREVWGESWGGPEDADSQQWLIDNGVPSNQIEEVLGQVDVLVEQKRQAEAIQAFREATMQTAQHRAVDAAAAIQTHLQQRGLSGADAQTYLADADKLAAAEGIDIGHVFLQYGMEEGLELLTQIGSAAAVLAREERQAVAKANLREELLFDPVASGLTYEGRPMQRLDERVSPTVQATQAEERAQKMLALSFVENPEIHSVESIKRSVSNPGNTFADEVRRAYDSDESIQAHNRWVAEARQRARRPRV